MGEEVVKLNLQGEICPYTLTRAIKKVTEIEEGLKAGSKVLEVVVDHHPIVDNYPAEFSRRGYQVEIEKIGPANWLARIKK